MKVLITGSSGLVGSAVKNSLMAKGYEVEGLLRNRQGNKPYWNISQGMIDLGTFGYPDAVIHLAGESIAEGRWNEEKKNRIEVSRVKGTSLLANFLAKARHKPEVFISSSAIGYYANSSTELLDETSLSGSSWLSMVAKKWEAATAPAADAGIRTVNIRTGIVLSKKGGALKKMLLPFHLGVGGVIGSGRQYMSWVSLDDMVRMIEFILQSFDMVGPINLVSPNPVTNHEFSKTLGRVLHRPACMPLPGFAVRMLFGEMADELLLSGARVMPKKLVDAGYHFCHTELEGALKAILAE